jgi:uncharacterized protein
MAILTRAAIAAAAALMFGASAHAASFDCNQARTPDEIAICENRDLNDMDVRMATLLDIAKGFVLMGERGAIQDDQRDWLQNRRRCGGDVECLRRSYRKRIGELEAEIQNIRSRGPY